MGAANGVSSLPKATVLAAIAGSTPICIGGSSISEASCALSRLRALMEYRPSALVMTTDFIRSAEAP